MRENVTRMPNNRREVEEEGKSKHRRVSLYYRADNNIVIIIFH